MNRLRILHIIASSHGGGATHVHDLATGLARKAFQVTVAMSQDGGNISPADFSNSGVRFIPLRISRGFAWREIVRIRQIIREGGFDLLHVHGMRAALYGRLAALTLRPRPVIVFSIHGFALPFYSGLKRAFYQWLERQLQKVTNLTICVARAEADSFLVFRLATQQQVQVIHYGIDLIRFSMLSLGTAQLRHNLSLGTGQVILTVCRLNVPRDFVVLLKAFQSILEECPQTCLLIVGDGPKRGEVEKWIERLNLSQSVRLAGFRTDIPDLMALAHLYVLTSYGWEGFPISALEAQAVGLPVVITDVGGSREAVQHEKTGLVVPTSNPQLLAAALLRLLKDPDMHRRLGEAGKARAQKEFALDRMVQETMEAYLGIVGD